MNTEPNEGKRTHSTAIEAKGFHWRGSFGVIFLLPAAVLTVLSQPLIPEGTWLDLLVDLLAWAVFAVGLLFRLWATLYVGARKTSTLVTEGPYSVTRNPLYFGSFCIAVASGLFLKSLVFAAALGLVSLLYLVATVPAEEKKLREIHGEGYDKYHRRVPAFWPRPRFFHTPDVVEVRVKGLRIECKRLLRWMWLPFIGELIAHARVEAWWPKLFHML